MNSIFSYIFYIAILWASIHIIEADSNTGLIFNTKFERLDEISILDGSKECPSCMVACPALSGQEILINQFASVTRSSVFMQNLYSEKAHALYMEANICDYPLSRPMIIYDVKKNTYEVGYELYHKGLENKMECNRFDDFKEITEEYLKILEKFSITKSTLQKKIKSKRGYDDIEIMVDVGTKFEFHDKTSFVFYWISVLAFRFHPSANQISVYLNADIANDYNLEKECVSYDLGNNLYQSEEKLYPFSSEVSGPIVKTLLIPLKYLHTIAGKQALCTQFNLIPVWSHVEERLKLIDLYLYKLYRHFNPDLNMFFGVSEIPKKEKNIDDEITQDQAEEKHELIEGNPGPPEKKKKLAEENDILMPEILYRVVEYTYIENGLKNHKKLVIIIHNEPNGVSDDKRLCAKSETSELDVLWNEKKENGILSYACSPDNTMLKKLGVYDEYPTTLFSTFRLFEFNLRFTDDLTILLENIKKDSEENPEEEQQPQ